MQISETSGHIGKFSEVDFLEFELLVLPMAMKRNPILVLGPIAEASQERPCL